MPPPLLDKPDGPSRARDAREPIAGGLLAHGEAPYQQRGGNPLSYIVTVETARGPRTVWAIDLRRGLRESETQPQVGDAVELLRSVSKALVTVKTGEYSASGDESAESKTTSAIDGWWKRRGSWH